MLHCLNTTLLAGVSIVLDVGVVDHVLKLSTDISSSQFVCYKYNPMLHFQVKTQTIIIKTVSEHFALVLQVE